jgi:glycosyltransferase 2 family protein
VDDVRSFIDAFQAFGGHLAAVSWGALAFACVLHIARLTARVRAWQNILRAAHPGIRIPFGSVFGGYWAGVAVNAIAPARGGDVVKAYIVKHRIKEISYPTLGSTLVVETLFDLVVASLLLVTAAAMGLLPSLPDLPNLPAFDWSFGVRHPRFALLFLSVLLVGIILLVTWASRHVNAFREKVRAGFAILGDRERYLREVVSWQALSWVFRIATVFFFLRAFHVPATVDTVLVVLVVGSVATTMPFTPGGAGTQQAVIVFALSGWASKSAILSFSVGMQLATVIVNVTIGFAAIALALGTLRWRDHVRAGRAAASGEPAPAPSRSTPPG